MASGLETQTDRVEQSLSIAGRTGNDATRPLAFNKVRPGRRNTRQLGVKWTAIRRRSWCRPNIIRRAGLLFFFCKKAKTVIASRKIGDRYG